jgi:hypothetical protein
MCHMLPNNWPLKWRQFIRHVANFYCATCHDLKQSRMDGVDFSQY